jgi:pimeloyl-ACP methyl ester carboxylesterase
MSVQGVHRPAMPVRWRVNGLELAGLSWGKATEKPLLALHGWLDNAASFARLAPLLPGYHIVALDLTGHGRSARRSADASYHIWDDLPEILGVLDELRWDTFDLVGHSRGAIIATLLAGAFPERVRHLVLLDAVAPDAVDEERFPNQLRTALLDKQRLLDKPNRTFPTFEDAVASRATRGLSASAARLLAERNLNESVEGPVWMTDPRLRGASAVKMTRGQIQAVLGALCMPTLLMLAEDTPVQYREVADWAMCFIEKLTVREISGGHHFHMESHAGEVALHLQAFLSESEECECA